MKRKTKKIQQDTQIKQKVMLLKITKIIPPPAKNPNKKQNKSTV